MIPFAIGLLCVIGAVGGVENLPAEPHFFDLLEVTVVFGLGVMLMLFGIDNIKRTK